MLITEFQMWISGVINSCLGINFVSVTRLKICFSSFSYLFLGLLFYELQRG